MTPSRRVATDIMTKTLICARPEQDLAAVEQLLIDNRIGGAPVVAKGRLVGVISRSDITRVQVLMRSLDGAVSDEIRFSDVQADGFQHPEHSAVAGFREGLDHLKVKDAMREQVATCQAQSPIAEIAQKMVRQHIHRVIVVEGDRPVGIVSSLDLVKLMAQ